MKREEIKDSFPPSGGILTTLVEHRRYEFILAKYIAVINGDGTDDRDSVVTKGWIGTTEL